MSGFRCDECNNVLTTKGNLETHKKSVHGPKVQCDQCQVLLTATSLRQHVRAVHEGKKQVRNKKKCTFCDKMFDVGGSFTNHMRTHTGEKPFICHFCDFSANESRNLKRHEDSVHRKRKWFVKKVDATKALKIALPWSSISNQNTTFNLISPST